MCRECGEMREAGRIPGDGEMRRLHGGETESYELNGKEIVIIISPRHADARDRFLFLFALFSFASHFCAFASHCLALLLCLLPFTFNDVIIRLPRSSAHSCHSLPPLPYSLGYLPMIPYTGFQPHRPFCTCDTSCIFPPFLGGLAEVVME